MQRLRFLFTHSVLFFLLCASLTATAQQRQSNISLGSSLTPTGNSSWHSRSGLYAFGFYQQGNGYAVGVFLVGLPEKTVVWTANRDNPPVPRNATLLFNGEGRLILQSAQGQYIADIAEGSSGAISASMNDSGNFVLYNSSGGIIWQSFDHPTDTILPTQRLVAGNSLFSSVSETDHSTGIFRLVMQTDGNLVQYPTGVNGGPEYAYWNSATYTSGNNVSLNLDIDGRLYLRNATGFDIKNITGGYSTGPGGIIYLMKLDSDGIFRLYSHALGKSKNSWSAVWESSKNKCDPKGVCGLNSFCVLNDQKPVCTCLPGFAFVSKGNLSSGCERNFTAESCINSRGPVKYAIQQLENTKWEDQSYSVLSNTTKENCGEACLEDCNCEIAIFEDTKCRMQRLPLRFGRRDVSSGSINVAFIKVGTVSSTNSIGPIEDKKDLEKAIILVICLSASLLLIMLTIAAIVIYRYRVWAYTRIPGNVRFTEGIALISFSYKEIEKLTDNFKEEIGRGASGTVFKGTMMSCQKFVAVKRLEKVIAEREREFLTEIKVIGRTNHRNLVRLLGYSCDGPNKILVYELMNGSLADILFTPERQPNWIERMGITRDIARGILYLHDECETQIIHCDIKPHNILMDENGCAKISDFGLAKLLKPDQTRTYTGIRGTRGYVAPEWHRNLPVTVKADVYSFGVMLLEIICCRRSTDNDRPEDQIVLEDWVYQCFEAGELSQLLGNEVVEISQVERMVKVALWCILDEPSLRPSMKKVLLMLEGTVDIPVPPNPTSYLSTI